MQITDITLQEQTANNTLRPTAKDAPLLPGAKVALPGQHSAETAGVKPEDDTVTLSYGAKVKLLYEQGNTADEIALKLHIDVKTVDSYLQIRNTDNSKAQQTTPAAPAASKSDGTDISGSAPVRTESPGEQAGTVSQNSSQPGSYAKTIDRFSGSGPTNDIKTTGTKG